MSDYPFPSWRRLIFVAALLAIIVLTLTPTVTKGSINIRVYALLPQGVVKHLYASFTGIQVHVSGLPQSSGWTAINQNSIGPNLDLVHQSSQLIPVNILTASISSGRYDSIMMNLSNATLVVQGGRSSSISGGSSLVANSTIVVPPNGNGDVLFVLAIDYSQLITGVSPSISARIVQVTSF